jgi:hypothetical protein
MYKCVNLQALGHCTSPFTLGGLFSCATHALAKRPCASLSVAAAGCWCVLDSRPPARRSDGKHPKKLLHDNGPWRHDDDHATATPLAMAVRHSCSGDRASPPHVSVSPPHNTRKQTRQGTDHVSVTHDRVRQGEVGVQAIRFPYQPAR